MISDLEAEFAEDQQNKASCENDQMTNTQNAKSLSKAMDASTVEIDSLNAAITAAKAAIGTNDAQVAELERAKEDATVQRNKEHAQYEQSKLDDQGAIDLLETAGQVME